MKTPMQELVDELKSELHISTLPEEREYNSGLRAALVMAEGLIEREKEFMNNAWLDGKNSRVNGQDPMDQIKTFKHNDE